MLSNQEILEQAVLGSFLVDEKSLNGNIELLDEDCFLNQDNLEIFKKIKETYLEGGQIDSYIIGSKIKNKDILVKLVTITSNTSSGALAGSYTKLLIEKKLLRRLEKIGNNIVKKSKEADADPFEIIKENSQTLLDISLSNINRKEITVKESVNELVSDIEEIKSGKEVGLVRTKISDLDNLIGGLKNSELIVLGARPSMGKSSLALKIARNVSDHLPVFFISLEMSHKMISGKLLSLESGLSYFEITTNRIKSESQQLFTQAIYNIMKLNLIIDDSPALDIIDIISKSRKLKIINNIGLIIIDYLQLIGTKLKIDNREREIALISGKLKSLAKELNLPILVLSQLNRSLEQRMDKRPKLSDLRESGAIEQDADVVMFLYRDEYYKIDQDENGNSTEGIAELEVAKNRNGSTGMIKLFFNKKNTDFQLLVDKNQIETYYNDIF